MEEYKRSETLEHLALNYSVWWCILSWNYTPAIMCNSTWIVKKNDVLLFNKLQWYKENKTFWDTQSGGDAVFLFTRPFSFTVKGRAWSALAEEIWLTDLERWHPITVLITEFFSIARSSAIVCIWRLHVCMLEFLLPLTMKLFCQTLYLEGVSILSTLLGMLKMYSNNLLLTCT